MKPTGRRVAGSGRARRSTAKEPRHGVGAAHQGRREQGGDARVEGAGEAPVARRRRARDVAAAHRHVAVATVERGEQVGDALGGVREVGVDHDDAVVPAAGDAVEDGPRQVGPPAAAHHHPHRQPRGQPRRHRLAAVARSDVSSPNLRAAWRHSSARSLTRPGARTGPTSERPACTGAGRMGGWPTAQKLQRRGCTGVALTSTAVQRRGRVWMGAARGDAGGATVMPQYQGIGGRPGDGEDGRGMR